MLPIIWRQVGRASVTDELERVKGGGGCLSMCLMLQGILEQCDTHMANNLPLFVLQPIVLTLIVFLSYI